MDACAHSSARICWYGLSNTVPLFHFENIDSPFNSLQTLAGCGFTADFVGKITIPCFLLKTAPNTQKPTFYSKPLKTGLFLRFMGGVARHSARVTLRATRSPRVGVMPMRGHADTYPTQAVLTEAAPFLQNRQAPEVRAVGSSLSRKPARKPASNARITKLVTGKVTNSVTRITELVMGKVTNSVIGRPS